MKPHRLALTALGPYPTEIEVDFDQLVEEGLFLIHGTTGSGKTFLLDAMCFALYGEVPGERGRDSLQAKGADPATKPRVELEFSAQGDRWRVHRTPIHELVTSRGTVSTKSSSAALERLDGTAWTAVTQGVKDVTDQVQHLVGLTASQFQQVILLPQGRFERVLRAGSEEREKLLQTLFDTGAFERATSWLRDQAAVRTKAVERESQALRELRARAAERWQAVAPHAGPAPHEGWPADQAELDGLVEAAAALTDQATAAAEAADAEHTARREAADDLIALAARWDHRADLHRRRQELVARQPAVDAAAETLASAEAAEAVRQLLDDLAARTATAVATEEQVGRAGTALAGDWSAAPSLPAGILAPRPADLADDDAVGTWRDALTAHRAVLEGVADTARRAAAKEHEAGVQRAEAERQSTIATQARATLVALRADAERDDLAREEARLAAEQLDGLTRLAAEAADRARAASELAEDRRRLVVAAERRREAERELHARRKAAMDLRQRRLDGMAAELAGELDDGDPCPVCGSTTHPAPAAPADDAVTPDDVAEADRRVAEAEEADEAARLAHDDLERRVAEGRGQAGDAADDPERAADEASRAEAARDEAAGRASMLDAIERRRAEAADQLAAREREAAEADVAAAAATAHADAAGREGAELRDQVTAAVGEVDPQTALEALDRLDASVQAVASAQIARREAVAARRATEASLTAALVDTPFDDGDAARRCLIGEPERRELAARIAEHRDALLTVDHDLAAADLASLPDARPDPTELTAVADAARVRAREANERRALVTEAHGALAEWAAQHRAGDAALGDTRADAELWRTVAARCHGDLPPRISLQRWVLSAYLEEICAFANQRLATMTGHRYSLSVHRESEKGGAKAGLGLRVHDTYNGQQRDVRTLSGGETFQASLCLALGVADAVSAHTGGVRLEALFVDEGFGTLDAEALQLAMDELDRLREGGRTVGLISHVAALRERIRVGIEVVPSEHGSTVRVGTVAPV